MKPTQLRWFRRVSALLVLLSAFWGGAAQAQSNLMISRQPDFSTEDREFAPGDTIFMKVEASDVDYSSIEYSAFKLIPRNEKTFVQGRLVNGFDGTFSGKVAVDDLDLVDYFWNWEAEVRDRTGRSYNERVFLRIGDPAEQLAGVEMRGLVQEKGDASFVLLGQTVFVNQETRYENFFYGDPNNPGGGAPNGPGSFADVQPNFGVETQVERTGDGQLVARFVRVLGPFQVPRFLNVSGRVLEVDEANGTFVVRGLTIAVTPYTGFGGEGFRPGASGVSVGQLVRVFGDFQDDGTVQAHFVEYRRAVQPELEVRGRISAFADNKITVQGFQFAITDATVVERLEDFLNPGGGGNCDPTKEDCGTFCDPARGDCPPVCDPATGDCPPVCDPAMGECPPPPCDPSMGECPPPCDPNLGECPTGKRAAASVEELQQGLIVRVVGVAGETGLTADYVLIESGDDTFVRISGPVEQVTETGFSIRGWNVAVQEYTPFFNEKFEQISFADLREGQLVMVFGDFEGDGALRANHVEYRLEARDEFTLFGPVTAVDEAGVTIWDVGFEYTESSRFELGYNQPLTREDIKLGQIVEVVSVPTPAGVWTVDVVRVPEGRDEGIRLSGLIENLTETGFTVLGQNVFFEGFIQVRNRQYEPVGWEELAEGKAVDVYGVFEGDGVKAFDIVLNGKEREEIEFWGVIASVDGDLVVVGGVPFVFTGSSKIFGEQGEAGYETLAAGLYVSIVGLSQGDGSFAVDRIFVPRQEDRSVRVTGELEAMDEFGLTLWGNTVVFTQYTQFHDSQYQPVDPTTIELGAVVSVWGSYRDDGAIEAHSVEVRGAAQEKLTLFGPVEAYDGTSVTIAGFTFLLTEQTQYFGDDTNTQPGEDTAGKRAARRTQLTFGPFAGKRLSGFDIAEGMLIEVFGVPTEAGDLVAVSVSLRDENGQASVTGKIAEINGETLRIRGRQIFTNPYTEVLNENFQPIALADLAVDQGVRVSGNLLPDGSIEAYRIELKADARPGLEVWGRVDGLQGDLVYVEGVPFLVTANTFFTAEDGSQVGLSSLIPGTSVSVQGELDEAGVLKATVVFVLKQRILVDFVGNVEETSETGFQVFGLQVQMQPWAQLVDENYQPTELSTLQVDDIVQASGELSEEGTLLAHFAQRFGAETRALEIRGKIAAVEGDLLFLNGRTFILTETTFVHSFDGTTSGIEALFAGLTVSVLGKPNEAGDLLAAKVYIENQDQDEQVRLRGVISEVSAEGFTVLGRQVRYSDFVNIIGEGYVPIAPDQLVDGQVVTVFGSLNREGVVNAYTVEAFVFDLEQLEFRGVVESFADGFVTIRGFQIAVDDQTQIQDAKGFVLGAEKLAPGTLVRVTAVPSAENGLRARWMQVGAGQEDRFTSLSGVISEIELLKRVITIWGRKVVVEDYAEIVDETFTKIRLAELAVGQKVRVHGFYEDGGRIRSWRVEGVGSENQELELRGSIEEIAGSTLVVRGVTFSIGQETWIDGGNGQPFPVADLEAGMQVGITGVPLEDGSYRARWLFVTSGNEDRNIRIVGRLDETDKSQRLLVIRDHDVYLNPQADIVGAQYEPISFDGLKVGANVQVYGWMQPNGRIEGWRAEVRVPEAEEFHLTGSLNELEGDLLVVAGVEISLTEETIVVAPDVGTITPDNLFAGLILEVQGSVNATGALVARKIQVFNMDPRVALQLRGIVSERAGDGFELGGIPVEIDTKTFVLDGNGRPIAPSSISNNNNVDVVALEGEGDGLLARFVQVFDIIRNEKTLIDRIETLGDGTFAMRGYTFRVDASTIMEDPLGNPMTFDDLFERMRVEVHGLEEGDGVYLARTVISRPRDQKLTGTLTDVGTSSITIAGQEVSVSGSTEIVDDEGEELSLGDLVAGQTINLTFIPGAGGVPVATRIERLPRIEDEVVISGTVEAAFGQLVVVLGRRFQVIPNTVFLDVDRNPIGIENLSVGEGVRVRGLLLAGDDLVALQVQQLGEGATDIRVEGPIVSVSNSVLEVMNVFFFINEASQFFGLDGEATDVTAFAEGQTVSVVGEGQPNGSILLTRVSVQNVALSQGEIGDIDGNTFTMFGTTYEVDENTIVLGDENAQLDLENLGDGQYVEVRGVVGSDGLAGKTSSAVVVSKVKIIDAEGSGEYELDDNTQSTSTEEETLPETFELHQNYPNPFNPVTTIRFALPQNTRVVLKVYDVVGREVQTLVSSELTAGTYDVQWNGRNQAGLPVASGVYLYRLDVGNQVMTRRMVLVK